MRLTPGVVHLDMADTEIIQRIAKECAENMPMPGCSPAEREDFVFECQRAIEMAMVRVIVLVVSRAA